MRNYQLSPTLMSLLAKKSKVTPFLEKIIDYAQKNKREIPEEVLTDFVGFFERLETNPEGKIDWRLLRDLTPDDYAHFNDLEQDESLKKLGQDVLDKVVVLKLNGGLGTSMGLAGAKSKIVVDTSNKRAFLDFAKGQVEGFRQEGKQVDLWFLNSFYTQQDTWRILGGVTGNDFEFGEILQNQFPKIEVSLGADGLPVNKPFVCAENTLQEWNPAGHGDIYRCLKMRNRIADLLAAGKKYLFISNVDNLGATLDVRILGYFVKHNLDFLLEVTPKTLADIKGGTIIRYLEKLFLLERAQVPEEHLADFEDCQRFKIFNTNNLWLNLESLALKFQQEDFNLPLIINKKLMGNTPVVQLETAMGAAINQFEHARVLEVPRSRFLPVKNNADLLLIRSDYTVKTIAGLQLNPLRKTGLAEPTVILDKQHFFPFEVFESKFKSLPSLVNIEHLELCGDITINQDIAPVFAGTVRIVSQEKPVLIAESVQLEDVEIVFDGDQVQIRALKNTLPTVQVRQENGCYVLRNKAV